MCESEVITLPSRGPRRFSAGAHKLDFGLPALNRYFCFCTHIDKNPGTSLPPASLTGTGPRCQTSALTRALYFSEQLSTARLSFNVLPVQRQKGYMHQTRMSIPATIDFRRLRQQI